MEKQRLEIQKKFDEQIREMNVIIKELKESKVGLENQIESMRSEMETLTKFEKRKVILSGVEEVFEEMAMYIGKVHNEKKKTVHTLRKLDALMQADRGTVSLNRCFIIW